jgi:hypothetical protein
MSITIACLLMVKNEEKSIIKTLNSLFKKIDGVILYDTGSTDQTLNFITTWSNENKFPIEIFTGNFVDFSTSRNILLNFAFEKNKYDYFLLMDANDELRFTDDSDEKNSNLLKNEILKKRDYDGFYLRQSWFISNQKTLNFYNIKLIKKTCKIQYTGKVHEYLEKKSFLFEKLEQTFIYQDRTTACESSILRWKKDLIILLEDYEKNPSSRTEYYLGQTYSCLNDKKNSLYYYDLRSKNFNGFKEEQFDACLKCGNISNDPKYYFFAFQLLKRVEPLYYLTKYFNKEKNFPIAFIFAKEMCEIPFPKDNYFFIDEKIYQHDRWQELSIASYYVKEFEIGKNACLKAIKSGYDLELNKKNLSFYENDESIKN